MEKEEDDESEIGNLIEKRKQENEAFTKLLQEIENQKNAAMHPNSKKKTK